MGNEELCAAVATGEEVVDTGGSERSTEGVTEVVDVHTTGVGADVRTEIVVARPVDVATDVVSEVVAARSVGVCCDVRTKIVVARRASADGNGGRVSTVLDAYAVVMTGGCRLQ